MLAFSHMIALEHDCYARTDATVNGGRLACTHTCIHWLLIVHLNSQSFALPQLARRYACTQHRLTCRKLSKTKSYTLEVFHACTLVRTLSWTHDCTKYWTYAHFLEDTLAWTQISFNVHLHALTQAHLHENTFPGLHVFRHVHFTIMRACTNQCWKARTLAMSVVAWRHPYLHARLHAHAVARSQESRSLRTHVCTLSSAQTCTQALLQIRLDSFPHTLQHHRFDARNAKSSHVGTLLFIHARLHTRTLACT
jgi:hypothetical protein